MAIIPSASAFFVLSLLLVSPLCSMAKDILYSGEFLRTGETMTAGNFTLVMQEDCNVVLYDNGIPVRASNTSGQGVNCYVYFHIDATIGVYDGNSNPLFVVNMNLQDGSYVFILQDTGNFVIYGPNVWPFHEVKGVFGALPADKATEKTKAAPGIFMVVNK